MERILQIGMSSNLGGIETFIMNLYKNIDKEKFQFDFIDFSENGIYYKEEIEKMGGKIYKITPRSKGWLKNKKELKKIISKKEYKIIHYHLNTLSYIEPIIIALKNGKKVIIHSHNEWKGKRKITVLLHKINYIRLLHKKNIIKLACSEKAGKWIFGKQKYTIVKNGIDIDKFKIDNTKRKKVRQELNADENTVIIGNVGAFRKQKNHEFIVDIFNEYLNDNSNSILVLVGDGELKDTIKKKVNDLGIQENVRIMGVRADTDYLYSAFDCFLFPSIYEGLGISLIEAQVSGLKCLISDVIPKEAIITDNVSIMSLNTNYKEWAKKINEMQLFDNREIAITKDIDEYDTKYLAESIEKIYSNIGLGEEDV